MRPKESPFFIQQQLVEFRVDILSPTGKAEFAIHNIQQASNARLPGRIPERKLLRTQLPAVPNGSIDDGPFAFAERTLLTVTNDGFCIAFGEGKANVSYAFNAET